ncbi:hypothetical protein X733_33535 [Mesorhizobium sp. L2C067A000]|nr:hypothetical protein X733_33535 [Mesorhizobium sp. L2C067A000]
MRSAPLAMRRMGIAHAALPKQDKLKTRGGRVNSRSAAFRERLHLDSERVDSETCAAAATGTESPSTIGQCAPRSMADRLYL